MHELGVLMQAVKTVNRIADENRIKKIKQMTLEIGKDSGFLPVFFEKLFPIAIEQFPVMAETELRMEIIAGKGLRIKEIGY
ncbi:MAG: hydrogenase maturation nickel metallochaperone HypA [Firmicutes bacterium]|nr:hydrogenase maturation nickel metallochaperone HypA [Bacillota bacterium]